MNSLPEVQSDMQKQFGVLQSLNANLHLRPIDKQKIFGNRWHTDYPQQGLTNLPAEVLEMLSGCDLILPFYNGQPNFLSKDLKCPGDVLVDFDKSDARPTLRIKNVKAPGSRSVVAIVDLVGNLSGVDSQKPFQAHTEWSIQVDSDAKTELFFMHMAVNEISMLQSRKIDLRMESGSECRMSVVSWGSAESIHGITLSGELKNNSKLEIFRLNKSGMVQSGENIFSLAGEGAHVAIQGVHLGQGAQRCVQVTSLQHQKPHTTSVHMERGIWAGKSQGIFTGRIVLGKNAPQSSAEQLIKNLILSPTANAVSEPQLEVFNDDVKAKHGATVAQLNDEELFYFQSRGISKKDAEHELVNGFIAAGLQAVSGWALEQSLVAILKRASDLSEDTTS